MSALQGLFLAGEGVVASTALPVLAWLLAKTYRRRAAGRRLVWVTAFAVLLALPLLALVAPSLAVIRLAAPAPMPVDAAAPAVIDANPGWSPWPSLIALAFAAWLAGLAKLAVEHLIALVQLELMRRKAKPWSETLPLAVRGCSLRVSEDCPGPMTWGVLRPVILLPDEAVDWPAARLEAVLRHELAHVRRGDGLAQALALAACALYWPNPLVWLAARAFRREAELAADDAVIAAGVLPSDYAAQLLALASEWRERRLTTTGLAMAAPPALSQRVQSALSTDAIRTGATAMDIVKLVLVGGVATAALTLARPSIAEVPSPAPDAGQAAPQLQQAAPAPQPAPRREVGPVPAPRAGVQRRRDIQLAKQDVQPAPPEGRIDVRPVGPDDLPGPPAPPAPVAGPVPPSPPAPPAAGIPPGGDAFWTREWIPNPNGPPSSARVIVGRMTPEQRAELDRKMAAIGPAIDKAIADAHIDETVQKALSAQDAKTREEVARQLQQIGPRIQQAIANAHIRELVGQRLAQLGPEFEAARKQAQERQAQAEERVAAQLEEQARRARERAKRDREQLDAAPAPAPSPKN